MNNKPNEHMAVFLKELAALMRKHDVDVEAVTDRYGAVEGIDFDQNTDSGIDRPHSTVSFLGISLMASDIEERLE